jgi:stage V sporulation protein D (sporulation-specific penicillin-binding protein)
MKKLKLVFVVVILALVLVILSLVRIQFFSENYVSDAGYLNRAIIPAKRGSIYDKNGLLLAGTVQKYNLTVDPKYFKPDVSTLNKLLKILEMPQSSYSARLKSGSDRWAKLAESVTIEKYQSLLELELVGLHHEEFSTRTYPEASLSATLLGFVGKDDSSLPFGYYGVEGYYESELKGLPGFYSGERDTNLRPIVLGFQDRLESQNGRDIYLTIDKSIQQMVKDTSLKGVQLHSPKKICIVVADPYSMALLGLTCLPDYDPGDYTSFEESSYRNSIISDLYEPGSTFKPLVVASAIDKKVIKQHDKLPEDGPITIGEYRISTWNHKYHGYLSVADVLAKSSNVGMVEIGQKLGNDDVYQLIQDFGISAKTGVDLQGEASGAVKQKSDWYPIDFATATFGQGLAVSPIQLLTSFSAIINDGELLQPYVVDRLSDGDNLQAKATKNMIRKVITAETSKSMRNILKYTVENAEYKWAIPQGYTFGGKTGTAQIPIEGKYDPTKTVASFIGFSPADKPKFIALVILWEPSSSSWGSETAAPLFFDLAKKLITYYNIKPQF